MQHPTRSAVLARNTWQVARTHSADGAHRASGDAAVVATARHPCHAQSLTATCRTNYKHTNDASYTSNVLCAVHNRSDHTACTLRYFPVKRDHEDSFPSVEVSPEGASVPTGRPTQVAATARMQVSTRPAAECNPDGRATCARTHTSCGSPRASVASDAQ